MAVQHRPICPWSFLDEGAAKPTKSYAAAAAQASIPIDDLPIPEILDGKTTVIISEEGYQSGLDNCKHMLIGRVQLGLRDKPYSASDLSHKLSLLWGSLGAWKIVPMGKGYFTFSFSTDEDLSTVWVKGAIALKPGFLRFMRWVPNFSPANQRNTNAQVSVDANTRERRVGLFARILVDIDLSVDPPHELVVKRKCGSSFVQTVDYEKLPDICAHCGNVGHLVTACKYVHRSSDPVPMDNETEKGRGRSRKRSRRSRRNRDQQRVSKVYVPKNPSNPADRGKSMTIDSTPNPREDFGEGPSFVKKSPAPVGQLVISSVVPEPLMEPQEVVAPVQEVVEPGVNVVLVPVAIHGNVVEQEDDTRYAIDQNEQNSEDDSANDHDQSVYARTTISGRRKLWEDITDFKGRFVTGPWLVFGDFNAVLGAHEKKGGAPLYRRSCEEFQAMSDVCELIHVDTKRAKFTWVRRRGFRGNVDRAKIR
ncbi:hypothetical protein ACLB2K_003554 [Fragaria x ananassa]